MRRRLTDRHRAGRPPVPLRVAALPVGAALAAVSLRRLVLLAAALMPPRATGGARGEQPSVTLVVPARNEEPRLGGLFDALARLSYPGDRLFVVMVDDGSDDGTGRRLREWADRRPGTLALELPRHVGKSEALNRGVSAAPPSDVVVVCDADLRPRPDWLERLVEFFGDPGVGAVASFLSPANALRSPVARYAAVESWVHQLVTSAGKDRLGLDPPLAGGAAYRRSALEAVGGFADVPSGEDVLATAVLTTAGWRTRFAPAAVADNDVADRWADYWHQHVRWARNVFSTAGSRSGAARTLGSVERRLFAGGYGDRVAFCAGLGMAAAGALPPRLPAAYLAIALATTATALEKAGMRRQSHRFVAWAAIAFPVDVAASLQASVEHVLRRPRTRRARSTRS